MNRVDLLFPLGRPFRKERYRCSSGGALTVTGWQLDSSRKGWHVFSPGGFTSSLPVLGWQGPSSRKGWHRCSSEDIFTVTGWRNGSSRKGWHRISPGGFAIFGFGRGLRYGRRGREVTG